MANFTWEEQRDGLLIDLAASLTREDKLKAEIKELTAKVNWMEGNKPNMGWPWDTPFMDGYETAKNELRSELDAYKWDAERYRWLRNSGTSPAAIWELLSDDCQPPHMTLKCMEKLDAAIDATMENEE